MTLKDIELTESNHFVAMEYYMLVLNRTYLILLINNKLIGLLGNGLISIEAKVDIFSSKIANSLSVRGDLRNPHSYLKEKYIRNIENINLLDGSILKKGFSNFIIDKESITDAWYDPSKKWGMGYYPHDGKVYIKTNKRKTREFIILGNQSGADIVNRILPK